MNEERDTYINFDEYIRQGEPGKRGRAEAWRVAIGLQAVDGLKTSAYLNELARKNIEGEITMDEVEELLSSYYKKKHANRLSPFDTPYERIDHVDPVEALHGRPLWLSSYFSENPTSTGQVQDKYRTTTRTTTRTSSVVTDLNPNSKIYTADENVIELVRVIGTEELSIKQMMALKGLKHRQNFLEYHLEPAMQAGFVQMKYPHSPNHPRQRYLLTVKGQMLLERQ